MSLIPQGLSLTERYSQGVTRESPGYHTLPKNAVPVRPLLQVAMRLDCLYLLPEAQYDHRVLPAPFSLLPPTLSGCILTPTHICTLAFDP